MEACSSPPRRDAFPNGAERQAFTGHALEALGMLERGVPPAPSAVPPQSAVDEGPLDEWTRLVEAISAEIARGTLEKVVLARRVTVELSRGLDPANVLARLRLEAAESTRFLVRREGSVFLGATPERLAKKHGASLETEAVAGSMSTLDREAARHLLESSKDLAEHALVVREIVRALEPLAERLEKPPEPELHELRHVLHLRTPIRADAPGHPASARSRRAAAPDAGGRRCSDRARRSNGSRATSRTSAAGTRDRSVGSTLEGDGEMAVALRSGVLEADRAHLYVGAGIVEHSAAQAELAETRWKLQTLLSALGIRGA